MQYATRLIPAGLILIAAIAAPRCAHGAEPPADLCSLLQPQDVSKVLGKSFNPPQKSVAPRPFANTVEGTDCHYGSKDRSDLMFRIYVDPSPGDSKSLHDRLSAFYQPATPIPGLGDQAYFDSKHAIHARKGKVRFFISLTPLGSFTPDKEQQIKDLALRVAGQL